MLSQLRFFVTIVLVTSSYLFLPECNEKYSVDVTGLVLVEKKSHNTGIGDFFLLLNAKKVVDGTTGISELVLSITSPEEIEGITGSFVAFITEGLKIIPVPFPNKMDDHSFTHLCFLQSSF